MSGLFWRQVTRAKKRKPLFLNISFLARTFRKNTVSFGYSGLKKSDDFRWKNSDAKKRYDAIKVAAHLEKIKVKSVDTKKVKDVL